MKERLKPGATVQVIELHGQGRSVLQGVVERLRGSTVIITLNPGHRISLQTSYPGLELQPAPSAKTPPAAVQPKLPNF